MFSLLSGCAVAALAIAHGGGGLGASPASRHEDGELVAAPSQCSADVICWRVLMLDNLEAIATAITGLLAVMVGAATYVMQAAREAQAEDRRHADELQQKQDNWRQEQERKAAEAVFRQMEWKLNFKQRQLGELYSPLLSRLLAGKVAVSSAVESLAWKQLVRADEIYADDALRTLRGDWRWFEFPEFDEASGTWRGEHRPQKESIVREWRTWMREVLQPNNEAIVELLLRSSHLILSENRAHGRQLFDQAINHVVAVILLLLSSCSYSSSVSMSRHASRKTRKSS